MSIAVTNEETAAPVQATPLFSLVQKREDLEKDLFLTLRVPRWEEPQIHVKYKPFHSDKVESALDRTSKSDEATVRASAIILVDCCAEVYGTLADYPGKKFSLRLDAEQVPLSMSVDTGVGFDPKLAQALGLPPHLQEAISVVRKLYATDGDIVTASLQVAEWSSQSSEKVDSDF